MTHRFYHIGVVFPFAPRTVAIDQALNHIGDDWLRYSSNTWIVWSEKSSNQLYRLLSIFLYQSEQILIFPIDAYDRDGLASQWIWQWLDSKRTQPEKTFAQIVSEELEKLRSDKTE